jgi:hypothetical protein
MGDSQISLPKAPILSYLSNISTPTRVRIIAARGVFWIGIFFFVLSVVLFCWFGAEFWRVCSTAVFFGRGRVGPVHVDILTRIKSTLSYRPYYVIYFFLILLFLLMPGLILFGIAAPIRRGRRVPSIIAMILLAPCILAAVWAATLFFGSVIVDIFGDHGRHHWNNAIWLILMPIPVLVILLLKDLCAFLFWIARNPTAEKPPTPFLPAGHAPGDDRG